MRKYVSAAFVAAALAGGVAMPASAAIVSRSFSTSTVFTASPVPIVTGSFSVTFDDSADIFATTSGFTGSVSVPLSSPLKYAFSAIGRGLVIANDPRPIGYGNPANSIGMFYNIDSNSVGYFSYTNSSQISFDSRNTVVTPNVAAPAVPEPATWAMMTLGFGAMGFAMRRKKLATRIRFA